MQQWINLLPEYDRVNVQNIIQQGTAEEVIQMLNSFKKWRNTEDEELQEQLQQYLEYLDSLSQDRDDIDIENFSEEEEILQQKLDEHLYNLNDNISIGKAYERYIGYLYEKDNWKVIFNGCIMGVEDDGIDLICQKDNEIHIIQAKNWAKKIYKKIVHQLYGSMNDYKLCNNHSEINITGIIFTTNGADYQAIKTAERLNIEIKIQKLDREYPLVKYKKTNNTYYLPPEISNKDTDKIYDELNIDYSQGDRYCKTIEDAEKLGF